MFTLCRCYRKGKRTKRDTPGAVWEHISEQEVGMGIRLEEAKEQQAWSVYFRFLCRKLMQPFAPLLQIRPLGDTTRGCHHHRRHLAAGRVRLLCAHLVGHPSARPAADFRGQWQKVSNMRSGPHAHLRRRVQLYQFLLPLRGHDWHLLSVSQKGTITP